MFKKYYLAYGSNLNLALLKKRCPSAKPVGIVGLENFRLVYKGSSDGYAYLTIEPSFNEFVPTCLFEISNRDIKALDNYESYPTLYHKEYVSIDVNGKTKEALIYIMNEEFTYHLPSDEYIKICEEGYKYMDFDKSILASALSITFENIKENDLKKLIKD